MINIQNKVDCCGCNACGDACAHGAISFKTDNEGFWYPEVDMQKCTDCHLCEKVCPMLHKPDNVERYAEFGERLFDYLMVTVDDVLWRDAFFAGFDGDRHTVFVAAANEHNFLSLCTQVAHIDVGGYIYTG